MLQCPNEPSIIVAIALTESYKGEVGVLKFIPTHLICPILRRAVFRVIHPAWTEALVQARARIDAMLR